MCMRITEEVKMDYKEIDALALKAQQGDTSAAALLELSLIHI